MTSKLIFSIDKETSARIARELPDLARFLSVASMLRPDFLSASFRPDSYVPIAGVCFQDVGRLLSECRFAWAQLRAHQIWFSEKAKPPNPVAAASNSLFFAEDICLRLYAGAEHLATAITFMLDLSDQDLKSYRESRTSQQVIVGKYLKGELGQDPLTSIVGDLLASTDWQKAMRFRGEYVHEQPPTVKEMGAFYTRELRWRRHPELGQMILGVGTGDVTDIEVPEVVGFSTRALTLLIDTSAAVLSIYLDQLRKTGFVITDEGSVTYRIIGA